MASYYQLVSQAVTNLGSDADSARRNELYGRALVALVNGLSSLTPPLPKEEITRECLALEAAIQKLEAELNCEPQGPKIAGEQQDKLVAFGVEPLSARLQPSSEPRSDTTPDLSALSEKSDGQVSEVDREAVGRGSSVGLDPLPIPPLFKGRESIVARSEPNAIALCETSGRASGYRPASEGVDAPPLAGLPPADEIDLDLPRILRPALQSAEEVLVERRRSRALMAVVPAAALAILIVVSLWQRDRIAPLFRTSAAARALLYEEVHDDPQGKIYTGSVVWTLQSASVQQSPTIRADLEIPERHLTMTMSIRPRSATEPPIPDTIDIDFGTPTTSVFGNISVLSAILTKRTERAVGTALLGNATALTARSFRIRLSDAERDTLSNLELLAHTSWFDLPIVCANGQRAILAIEKGESGKAAFTAWKL